MALGGSTNSAIHLLAVGRRASVDIDLSLFDALSRDTPVIADIRPSGRYLMEDFYYAGGLRGLLSRLSEKLSRCRDGERQDTRREFGGCKVYNDGVIRRSITRCPRRAVWSC